MSCKETWFVSGGGTSAEAAEAANCASTTNSCRQPANGDGNVGCICCAISSPFAGPWVDLLTLRGGTIEFSALLVCLCRYKAALPKESFFTFVPLGNGDEGDESFEAPVFFCSVLASSPAVSYIYGWPA